MTNPKVLFLDDNKNRTKRFCSELPFAHTAETAQGMIELIQKHRNEKIDFIFLDHDLGGEVMVSSNREDCGMEVVRWLVTNKTNVEQVIAHTLNYDAGKEMVAKLREVGYEAMHVPFIRLMQTIKANI